MKHSASVITALVLLLFSTAARSQSEFEVPQNVELTAKEDYSRYESDIVSADKWLLETDLDKESGKRAQVSAFVLKWISGSPTVTITVDKPLLKLVDKNAPLMIIYLAGYARYMIEHRSCSGQFEPTKAGLTDVITVYRKGIGVKREKQLTALSNFTSDEQWNTYVQTTFKVQAP